MKESVELRYAQYLARGIMHLLEVLLGRRLVRVICELHTNELPLRHIIEQLDGPTSGANSFAG